MRLSIGNTNESSRMKVQIKKIVGETIECKHITSNYQITAYIKKEMQLSVGQVVMVEFKKLQNGGGYIVVDDLIEEVDAKVLDAQHIISDGMMYTSLILENTDNKKRLHSLVPSNNKLFSSTSIIITGDIVKLKINNGVLFNIEY